MVMVFVVAVRVSVIDVVVGVVVQDVGEVLGVVVVLDIEGA